MHTGPRSIALALAVLAVGLAACGDGTGVETVEDLMTVDAAVLAADATLEEVAMFREPIGFRGLNIPGVDDVPEHRRRPGRPGGSGAFQSDVSGTRAVSFYDVAGAEQSEYDTETTASVHILHDVEGMVARARFNADISRERDLVVTGLEGEETHRTWNGSGSSSMSQSGVLEDGTERTHSSEANFAYVDVVVPIPGTAEGWPVSGTIRRTMVMTRSGPDGTETRDFEIEIVFDGTSTASAVVNGEPIEIDLSARQHERPMRRRPVG